MHRAQTNTSILENVYGKYIQIAMQEGDKEGSLQNKQQGWYRNTGGI